SLRRKEKTPPSGIRDTGRDFVKQSARCLAALLPGTFRLLHLGKPPQQEHPDRIGSWRPRFYSNTALFSFSKCRIADLPFQSRKSLPYGGHAIETVLRTPLLAT